ncbi:MAG TPA: hypothetical protein VF495_23520 [Phenylobacterium sp.]
MSLLADHIGEFILVSLGLTYLIGLVLILAKPTAWRLVLWLWQVTSFVMAWVGLRTSLGYAILLALAGGGMGVLASWRWFAIAEELRAIARRRRARQPGRPKPPRLDP